jgi:hypothetical protein
VGGGEHEKQGNQRESTLGVHELLEGCWQMPKDIAFQRGLVLLNVLSKITHHVE